MKKNINKFFLFIFICLAGYGYAQIPSGYYNNAQGKTGNDLKVALHNIIKGHDVVSYSGLLDAYAYTDCDANGKIWDIYSNYRWNLSKSCGNYDNEGDCWNREHTWPQSWFNEKSGPKSDLFHVMPTDGYVNNLRSNFPYGEVSHPTYTSSNGCKKGPCVTPGYSGTVFEPADEYKGDIARNFFYMSVRYYGEDSGWSSSGMTNKATILDWAMTMLLRWHEADPVSQKEIDRNNAVYGYQNNRNPFIDHPEYARMIWDPNWTEGNSYSITCASNLSHGSITAPESAIEGTTVAITAIPDPGYMVDTYNVYKTGNSTTTVNVNSNGTFVMPDYDVTISATFKQNTTLYTVTTAPVTHGSISVSTTSALSGSTITMTANPDEGYSLYSWYVYKTGDMNTNVYNGTTGSFVMPAFNVTVNATFSTQGSSANGDFVKVTENLDDWSGEYLIVYEDGNVAFDGGLTTLDATTNTINVNINNNTIEATQNNIGARFIITKTSNGYSIKSASGYYIGQNSDANGLSSSNTTAYANTISYNSTSQNTDIIGQGGAYLRYNNMSGQNRFRYYKSASYTAQKAIQLFRRTTTAETPTHTIHFYPNGATGSSYDQTVEEYVPTTLTENTFTREGFVFDGWNTQANGEGTYYADNATITLTSDIDLYAQWEPEYAINLIQPDNGTISASATSAIAESTITLTATPNEGFEFESWIVTDGSNNNIEVEEDQFVMPADHVTVTATFIAQSVTYDYQYTKVTNAPTDWSGQYLIVYESGNKALDGSLTTLDAANNTISVSINDNVIPFSSATEAAEFTISPSDNGYYTIKNTNGLYIGRTSDSNGLDASNNTLNNSIDIDNGTANIISSGGAYLRYNNTSSQNRFRYYKSTSYTSQKPIQLYRKTSTEVVTNTYTVTFHPNEGVGDSYTQTITENIATPLSPNTFTREGYLFNGWNTQADGQGTSYTDEEEVTLTTDLDLYAQWTIQESGDETWEQNYYLVTSTDQLVNGRSYIIVNLDAQKALANTQNSNNRASTDVVVSDEVITNIGNACELQLGASEGAWTLFDANQGTAGGYLYAASSTSNQLRTIDTINDNARWSITINEQGSATITAQGENTRNQIRYNSSNNPPIFSCYASGQKDVVLFIRSEEFVHSQSESIDNLFYFDKHIVHSGATLTVNGNAKCNNPEWLILQDGAELIHHDDNVQATVQKNIEAYTDNGGWFTIAMPMASLDPTKVNDMVSDSYDLYAYDEDAELEWINHKTDNGFNLTAGQGYLYAHNPGITIEAKGILNNGGLTQTVNLSYANIHESIKGFNLLGNPTAHEIQFSKSDLVSDGYYYITNGDNWIYEPTNSVPAGRGFLVKANAENQSVVLNSPSRDANTNSITDFIKINVDDEVVYIKTTDGVSMPAISFNGKSNHLSLNSDGKAYVMLVRNGAESIELSYHPDNNGTHTLSVSAPDTYLHLIDRITGADIDLNESPIYTFHSKANDYESRFQLVFTPQEHTGDSDPFAHISDGNIVITGVEEVEEASLQVIDILGRVIINRQKLTSRISTNGMAAGVYTLRLTSPEGTKTQKITID